jgi:hypothetical protein
LRICIATIFLSLQHFSASFLPGLLCRFLLYHCLTELFFLRRDCFGGVIQFPSAELQFLFLGVPSTTGPGVSRTSVRQVKQPFFFVRFSSRVVLSAQVSISIFCRSSYRRLLSKSTPCRRPSRSLDEFCSSPVAGRLFVPMNLAVAVALLGFPVI